MNKKPISHTEQRLTFLFGSLIGPTTVAYNVTDVPHHPLVASHAYLLASLHILPAAECLQMTAGTQV